MTLAATISPTGISAPTYAEILTALQNAVRSIYGSDIYLGNDSQDGQMLAVFAQAIYDNNQLAIAVYQSYRPSMAQGVGLSSIVKINGIRRLVSSNSSTPVDIVGQAGIPIINGIIGDNLGLNTQWTLPPLVTIPLGGAITVTATCTAPGAIAAAAGTLTRIITPTAGWQSVSNPADADPGAPVEVDAQLRQRQTSSTAIPALSVIDAILGAIENLPGVGRAFVYENDTDTADGDGIPAHSISAVIQGGDVTQIGQTIQRYKTPGTGTYGTTSVMVIDAKGIPITINFYVLSVVQIFTLIFLTPLAGYVSTTAAQIQASLAQWFSNLAIGEDSYLNRLWTPANLGGDAATTATAMTQAALDALSNTYNLTGVWQARADMDVIGGPYAAGANVVNIANPADLSNAEAIKLALDDGSFLTTTITGIAGTAVTMATNIPGGRTVQNGALMYAAGDLAVAFNEAAGGTAAHQKIVVP